jgi:hypothetical protein
MDQHHGKESFQDEFRRSFKKYEVDFDERYVWIGVLQNPYGVREPQVDSGSVYQQGTNGEAMKGGESER